MVLRIWSRLVQQLLKKELDQSVGRMPIVTSELLVCLLPQLALNYAKLGQNYIRKMEKGARNCSC